MAHPEVGCPADPEGGEPTLSRWLIRAHDVLQASAPAIDAINVFPVADRDTGTNVALTLAAAAESLDAGPAAISSAVIGSAHGSSGAILAQLIAVMVRRWPPDSRNRNGRRLSETLQAAAEAATAAVLRPVSGTILTVADVAARAADREAATGTDTLSVARAALRAGGEALRQTTDQLPALRSAGVVDAGGQALLLVLASLVEVLGGEPVRPLAGPGGTQAGPHPTDRRRQLPGPDPAEGRIVEVVLRLVGATPTGLRQLGAELDRIADSVVISAESEVTRVHAHVAGAEPVVALALRSGQVRGLRVTPLDIPPEPTTISRTEPRPAAGGADRKRRPIVIMEVGGLTELIMEAGGVAVSTATTEVDHEAALAVALATAPRPAVVIGSTTRKATLDSILTMIDHNPAMEFVAAANPLEALAALAVHDPGASAGDAASAMRSAAAATTVIKLDRGAVDVDLPGPDAELITVLSGPSTEDEVSRLLDRLARSHPDAELERLTSQEASTELMIGWTP